MSKRTYIPKRGDLIEINFQPAAGREMDKRRPAIILSPLLYNRERGLCLGVPLTTDLSPGPLWIPMPAGFVPRSSQILCDCLKNFDYRERNASYLGQVPDELVERIVEHLLDLLDPMQ